MAQDPVHCDAGEEIMSPTQHRQPESDPHPHAVRVIGERGIAI
jgi:hypothetical protein